MKPKPEASLPISGTVMLRRYVEQILKLYNYIDGIVVCNKKGCVEYYTNYRPDINSLNENEVLGKHILDIYPYLNAEDSSILRVLESGEPIYNESQTLMNLHGECIQAINTTLPIKSDDSTIIGAVDVSRYLGRDHVRNNITLSLKKPNNNRDQEFFTLDDIYGHSLVINKIKNNIARIADTHSTVMIYGETGTGKELVAQAIHSHGVKRSGPFISQNCAAIPSSLLEGILFGTERGSYTGATNRPGLFELANGGTLFLDEVNSMEYAMQSKILKAIEEKSIRRVGSSKTIHLDLRVVSAVNEDPREAVEHGRIRKDLFFRLSTVLISLPPLRDRREDISFLTRCFIRDFNLSMNRQVMGVTEDVDLMFAQYNWPGNVRELKNVIEGAFNFLSGRFIKRTDLPEYLIHSFSALPYPTQTRFDAALSLSQQLWDFERRILLEALQNTRSLTEMASTLKISKQVLNYKLHKFNIHRPHIASGPDHASPPEGTPERPSLERHRRSESTAAGSGRP